MVFDGGEGGIRTHGSCESLVFKTSSLNHSDTPPNDATLVIISHIFWNVNSFYVNFLMTNLRCK